MKAFGGVLLCLAWAVTPVLSKERDMTYEEYLKTLHSVIAQEKSAREGIAREQGLIENLKQQVSQIQLRIASVIQELNSILGVTEQDVLNAEAELNGFGSAFQQYLFMNDDDLMGKRSEIANQESRFASLRAKRVCLLYRLAALAQTAATSLSQLKRRLENVRSNPVTVPRSDMTHYTVGKNGLGSNLWDIAGEVYNDPYQWPKIYRANKRRIDQWFEHYKSISDDGMIRRPQDFLLPGRTLVIPQ
jgi:hypothetical protein